MTTSSKYGQSAYLLDKHQVRSAFDKAASSYDEVAVLQREVGHRMLDRLDLIRIRPQIILDAGSGTGHFSASLAQRYAESIMIAFDLSTYMLAHARRHADTSITEGLLTDDDNNPGVYICGDLEQLPLANDCVDMIFSNLTLQWCNDLERVFTECRRILKPGGLFMFSTFGPDTLKELRECWRKIDGFTHVNSFIDMHDIGDALLRNKFSEPVMDIERFTLTYGTVLALMKDLKALGAHNTTAGRRHSLTGKGRFNILADQYEKYRCDDVLPASYEVIYGHAWIPEDKQENTSPGIEARIPLSQLRRRKA